MSPIPFTRALRVTLAAAAVTGALAAPTAAQQSEEVVYERQYTVRFLSSSQAMMVAQNHCPAEGQCRIGPGYGSQVVQVRAAAPTHSAISAALRAADVAPVAQAFQVILLRADRLGSAVPEALPASARKAIADLSDFLPFSRFEMLGTAFFRTTHSARVLVEGAGGQEYELELAYRGDAEPTGGQLLVERFRLGRALEPSLVRPVAEAAAAAAPRAPQPPASTEAGGKAGSGSPAQTPAPTPAPPTTSLLSTSFSMARGETLVVGTSKLDGGDEALVVLLTALP